MPVPYKPTGRPRGRPLTHATIPYPERAALFVERAARTHDLEPLGIRFPKLGDGKGIRAARRLVAYALRFELNWTHGEIANYLGWSNHSSVHAALVNVETLIASHKPYAELHAQIIAP